MIVIFALAVGAFGAHFLLEDSGYVLINMRGYAVEMSVPGLVLGLVSALCPCPTRDTTFLCAATPRSGGRQSESQTIRASG